MNLKNKKTSGFTLIELLVVIAIIAVLMVVVLVTLNPAELLRQSRDSNRLSDMATLKTSLSLYQADVATSTAMGTTGTCYNSFGSTASCVNTATTGEFKTVTVINASSGRAVDSSGWVPINFNLISSGAPITQLPSDPANSAASFYGYEASGTALFKLTMKTESAKFSASGTADVESTDGGSFNATYETGPGAASL